MISVPTSFGPDQSRSQTRTLAALAKVSFSLLIVSVLASGCASLPTSPFEAFTDSLVALKDGTDASLSPISSKAEARFRRDVVAELEAAEAAEAAESAEPTAAEPEEAAATEELEAAESEAEETGEAEVAEEEGDTPDESLIEQLQIKSNGSPYAITSVPLFLKLEQFRIGASQTTAALVQYGKLLQHLASPELLPGETFTELATDLNANAMQALNAMTTNPSSQAQANVGLLSQVSIAALEAYLKSRRKQALSTALEDNQVTVRTFAALMQSAVDIMAAAAQSEYNAEYQEINQRAFVRATRAKAIDDLIAIDRAYVEQITVLQELRNAYARVPASHQELAAIVGNSGQDLSAIVGVLEAGKRLQARYGQAIAANRVATAQATAVAATARADAREAQAETAALRAAAANAEAIAARIEADEKPEDQNRKGKAVVLEERAKTLLDKAEGLRKDAEELRAAANTVVARAGEIG